MDNDIANLAGATILVTGGTGFTGSHLLRRLTGAGLSVRAVVRPSSNRTHLADLPVEWHEGDVFDPAVIHEAMQGVHYVFHMATLYRTGDATEEEHRQVHVRSTELLCREAIEQADFKRFIHVSTIGVHGHIESPPANEETVFRPGDEYQRTKAEAEEWLTAFAAETRLPYTSIRPAAIYGPGDQRLLKIFRMAGHAWCPILGRRPCLYHLIHVDDLVGILIRSAVHPHALGEAFIAGNPDPIPLDRMLKIIAAARGRSTRIIRLPVLPFWLLAALCETVCRPLGLTPPLYRRRIKFFLNDRAFDTRKVRERLEYAFTHSDEEGLTKTAHEYMKQGML